MADFASLRQSAIFAADLKEWGEVKVCFYEIKPFFDRGDLLCVSLGG